MKTFGSSERVEPVRAALYGAGAFGYFLAQSLAQSTWLRLGAVASRSEQSALQLAARVPDLRPFANYDDLLAQPDIECVLIATPPAQHAADAHKALAAGKHALVEKPFASTAADAQALAADARRHGLVSGVDFPMPYSPLVRALVSLERSRVCGTVQYATLGNIASSQGLDDDHWFWDLSQSGGIFVEHGVHFFDWCGSLFEPASGVSAWTATEGKRQNRVFACVNYGGWQLATYYHAFVASPQTERTRVLIAFESVDALVDGWMPTELRLCGRDAQRAARVIGADPGLVKTHQSEAEVRYSAGEKQSVYAQGVRDVCADFAAAIRNPQHQRLVDDRRAVASVCIADAARRSASEGAAVSVDVDIIGPSQSPVC